MSRNPLLLRLLLGVLCLLVVASGCRTYGGYGTTEAIPPQMQQAVQQFADALGRAQADAQALADAASQNSALEPLEARYRDLIVQHETFLAHHREIAERFAEGGSYRDLNRNYGAIISEQRLVRTRYNEMHARIRSAVTGQPVALTATAPSRYVVNPSYYSRVQNRQALSMQDALRGSQ